jgi:hypothetical protein
MMRKKVQFNSQNMYDDQKKSKEQDKAPTIDMNLNWILSICYDDKNHIKDIKNLENFDKSIKKISHQDIKKYDENIQKNKKTKSDKNDQYKRNDEQIGLNNNINDTENMIYVFECRHWLAKDMEDKKIERVLKPTNLLKSK